LSWGSCCVADAINCKWWAIFSQAQKSIKATHFVAHDLMVFEDSFGVRAGFIVLMKAFAGWFITRKSSPNSRK